MESVNSIYKKDYGKMIWIKNILFVLSVVTMIYAFIPKIFDLILAAMNYMPLKMGIVVKDYFFTILVKIIGVSIVQTILHEFGHFLAITLCKGHAKIKLPKISVDKCKGKLPKIKIINPQVIAPDHVFTRNEYVVCLWICIPIVLLVFVLPYFLISRNIVWTMCYIFLALQEASNDIVEGILLITKYSKNDLVKMIINQNEKCIGIDILQ